jgi:hypothetical protein
MDPQSESGQNKWSDDSVDIETPLLASSVRPKQNKLNRGASNMTKSPVVWFCSDFQKKICPFFPDLMTRSSKV